MQVLVSLIHPEAETVTDVFDGAAALVPPWGRHFSFSQHIPELIPACRDVETQERLLPRFIYNRITSVGEQGPDVDRSCSLSVNVWIKGRASRLRCFFHVALTSPALGSASQRCVTANEMCCALSRVKIPSLLLTSQLSPVGSRLL